MDAGPYSLLRKIKHMHQKQSVELLIHTAFKVQNKWFATKFYKHSILVNLSMVFNLIYPDFFVETQPSVWDSRCKKCITRGSALTYDGSV